MKRLADGAEWTVVGWDRHGLKRVFRINNKRVERKQASVTQTCETCPWLSRIMTNLSRVRRVTPLLHTIMSSTSFPFASSSCCPLASRLLFHNSCLRGRPLPMSPLLICFGVFPAVFCRLCAQQRLPFSILSCIAQCLSLIPILLLFPLKKKNISPLP